MSLNLNLQQTAARLSITRPALIRRLREADLLDKHNLPRHPTRDRLYLQTRDGNWYHPELGMQYTRSTRVTQAGVRWLAEKLGIDLVPPTAPVRERADVD
ncbi:Phage antirepressor protein KilAC domain protein [compost metagenome]